MYLHGQNNWVLCPDEFDLIYAGLHIAACSYACIASNCRSIDKASVARVNVVSLQLCRQWSKILRGQVPISHFIFHRKAKLGKAAQEIIRYTCPLYGIESAFYILYYLLAVRNIRTFLLCSGC